MVTSAGSAPHSDITRPDRLWSRPEVLSRPSPVPASAGVYGWYFDRLPSDVPTEGCHRLDGRVLAYVGLSPKAPPRNGRPRSGQSLRTRITHHYRGNAEGSSLRLTLGCLLAESLVIELRRVGSGNRYTFGEGEEVLSEWMGEHAWVCWQVHAAPWDLESALIAGLDLPLNLDQNRQHPFASTLSSQRRRTRARARDLPVVGD